MNELQNFWIMTFQLLYWRKKTGQLIIYPSGPAEGRFKINYFLSLVLNGRKNRPTITTLHVPTRIYINMIIQHHHTVVLEYFTLLYFIL